MKQNSHQSIVRNIPRRCQRNSRNKHKSHDTIRSRPSGPANHKIISSAAQRSELTAWARQERSIIPDINQNLDKRSLGSVTSTTTVLIALTAACLGSAAFAAAPVWPVFGHDSRHTGQSEYAENAFGILKWALVLQEGNSTTAIAADNTVYTFYSHCHPIGI